MERKEGFIITVELFGKQYQSTILTQSEAGEQVKELEQRGASCEVSKVYVH